MPATVVYQGVHAHMCQWGRGGEVCLQVCTSKLVGVWPCISTCWQRQMEEATVGEGVTGLVLISRGHSAGAL